LSDRDSGIEARLENIRLARIQIATTVMVSMGAVFFSVGYAFILTTPLALSEKVRENVPTNELQILASLATYSNLIAGLGLALIIIGGIIALVATDRMRNRLRKQR